MRLDPTFKRALDRTPTMPADEQQRLATRYAQTRDPSDAQRLVVGNLRLVLKIVHDLGGRHHGDAMDLVQEGCAGLADAVRRFDPARGVKLSSYAAWWIRAYVMRYLMDSSRIVHFSSTREGRRRFFDGTLPGPDRSLDTPVKQDGAEPRHPMLNVLPGHPVRGARVRGPAAARDRRLSAPAGQTPARHLRRAAAARKAAAADRRRPPAGDQRRARPPDRRRHHHRPAQVRRQRARRTGACGGLKGASHDNDDACRGFRRQRPYRHP
jgi:RNA polymerase sigma factor (sigma-70 family)